jgi:hypothetical protein
MDYKKELQRRRHANTEVLQLFSDSARIYESVWYGRHEAGRTLLETVMQNQERLRNSAV